MHTAYDKWVTDRDAAGKMSAAEADAYYTALEQQRATATDSEATR